MRLWPWRRRVEQRAITEVPWNEGGPLRPSAVSVDRALKLGPVYAACRLLADSVSSLPLQQYRRAGDSRVRMSLASLLATPSVIGNQRDWIFRAMTSLALRGNAVGLITSRNGFEYPTGVEWLNPDDVTVLDAAPSGPGSFQNPLWYWHGRRLNREDIVHIPWFVLPGKVWGLSPIAAFASTVNIGLSAQGYASDWFDSGGAPVGVFKNTEKQIDQNNAAEIKRRLVSAIRTHEPIVHGADWEYSSPITVSQQDAMFVETMRLGATEIASIYGIYPPERIGGSSGNSLTYSNVEQDSIDFVQTTLMPWLTRLEAAFNGLLPAMQYVKFNVDARIRPDASTRFQNYRIARDIGIYNRDEIRALEDMPPLPGAEGTDYTPLEILAKAPAPAPAPGHRQLELVGDGEDRDTSQLKYGPGHALWEYWTKGEGLAKWINAVHKWTTLHRLLIKAGVPAHMADGLATNIIEAVLPGYMKQAHKKSS